MGTDRLTRRRLIVRWLLLALAVIGPAVGWLVWTSIPHVWFETRFSTGEELLVTWRPSKSSWREWVIGLGHLEFTVDGKVVRGTGSDDSGWEAVEPHCFKVGREVDWMEGPNGPTPLYMEVYEVNKGFCWDIDRTGILRGTN